MTAGTARRHYHAPEVTTTPAAMPARLTVPVTAAIRRAVTGAPSQQAAVHFQTVDHRQPELFEEMVLKKSEMVVEFVLVGGERRPFPVRWHLDPPPGRYRVVRSPSQWFVCPKELIPAANPEHRRGLFYVVGADPKSYAAATETFVFTVEGAVPARPDDQDPPANVRSALGSWYLREFLAAGTRLGIVLLPNETPLPEQYPVILYVYDRALRMDKDDLADFWLFCQGTRLQNWAAVEVALALFEEDRRTRPDPLAYTTADHLRGLEGLYAKIKELERVHSMTTADTPAPYDSLEMDVYDGLHAAGFASVAAFDEAANRFRLLFRANAIPIARQMLMVSRHVLGEAIRRYQAGQAPGVQLRDQVPQDLRDLYDQLERSRYAPDMQALRQAHPILRGSGVLAAVGDFRNEYEFSMRLTRYAQLRLADVGEVEQALSSRPDLVFGLPVVVAATVERMGLAPDSIYAQLVHDQRGRPTDVSDRLVNLALLALSFVPGPVGLTVWAVEGVRGIGGAALDYGEQSAAAGADLAPPPSLRPLIVQVVAATAPLAAHSLISVAARFVRRSANALRDVPAIVRRPTTAGTRPRGPATRPPTPVTPTPSEPVVVNEPSPSPVADQPSPSPSPIVDETPTPTSTQSPTPVTGEQPPSIPGEQPPAGRQAPTAAPALPPVASSAVTEAEALARRPLLARDMARLRSATGRRSVARLRARLAELQVIDQFSAAPRNARIVEVSIDPKAANFYQKVAETVPEAGVVLEFPEGDRVWRDTTDSELVWHESTIRPGTGRAGFELDWYSATEHGNIPSRPRYQRAHTEGHITGEESPYDIRMAPEYVNQTLQNHGIETYMDRLGKAARPGEQFRRLAAVRTRPRSPYLGSIDYRIVRISAGRLEDVATYSIQISGFAEFPRVTAGPLRFAATADGRDVAGRVQIPQILTTAVSVQL